MRNKKLNRKGFTLVELLAVIVVLAIILVITVPMILNTIGNSKHQAFESSLKTVVTYYRDQLSLASLGRAESEIVSTKYNYDDTTKKLTAVEDTAIPITDFKKLGMTTKDYKQGTDGCTVAWDADGNVTVKLVAAEKGQFDGEKDLTNTD